MGGQTQESGRIFCTIRHRCEALPTPVRTGSGLKGLSQPKHHPHWRRGHPWLQSGQRVGRRSIAVKDWGRGHKGVQKRTAGAVSFGLEW